MNLNDERPSVDKTNSNYLPYSNYQSTTTTSVIINNVTVVNNEDKESLSSCTQKVYNDFHYNNRVISSDIIPTFLAQCDYISIPSGVKRSIERLPKRELSKVDKNKKNAVEKCLIIASNCTSTLFYENEDSRWKNLKADFLDKQVRKGRDNTRVYKNVINALTYHTNSTQPIFEIRTNIEGNPSYLAGEYSIQYRFHQSYCSGKIIKYQLKNPDSIQKRRLIFLENLNLAYKNPISYNLLNLYPKIELPTDKKIIQEGKKRIKSNHITKKGKVLASLNNKKKESIKDYNNKSFIEDGLKHFRYLTSHGYLIPLKGSIEAGGRVPDSFNLMNSWIREECTIDGEEIAEVDFRALHPNINVSLYGGQTKFLTHQKVAQDLNKEVKDIKVEHLAFFNKHPNDMMRSILFEYYSEKEPTMLNRIINEKKRYNYKITSQKLFKKEVKIMEDIIVELNKNGVFVGYVYDALFCKKSQAEYVLSVMNKVILKHGVYTTASINYK